MLQNKGMYEKFMSKNILLFVGGRVHQQDNHAQDIVYDLLELLSNDEALQKRVVSVDNFNVWEAPLLFKGADGAIMLADDTREASATGFMKAQMNGAAILATSDGAVPEFVTFQGHEKPGERANGFFIPYIKGEPTAQGLLEALEAFNNTMMNPISEAAMVRCTHEPSAVFHCALPFYACIA
jgi:glucan phosphorylase